MVHDERMLLTSCTSTRLREYLGGHPNRRDRSLVGAHEVKSIRLVRARCVVNNVTQSGLVESFLFCHFDPYSYDNSIMDTNKLKILPMAQGQVVSTFAFSPEPLEYITQKLKDAYYDTQIRWGGQTGMARSAVWSRSLS